jgi:hypothetical protein
VGHAAVAERRDSQPAQHRLDLCVDVAHFHDDVQDGAGRDSKLVEDLPEQRAAIGQDEGFTFEGRERHPGAGRQAVAGQADEHHVEQRQRLGR